jgi:hypothetical protein
MRKRPDWSRPLPAPLQILDENDKPIITLKTLRAMFDVGYFPPEHRRGRGPAGRVY